jgi:hypothetical protein
MRKIGVGGVVYFGASSHYVVLAGLKFVILLPQSP